MESVLRLARSGAQTVSQQRFEDTVASATDGEAGRLAWPIQATRNGSQRRQGLSKDSERSLWIVTLGWRVCSRGTLAQQVGVEHASEQWDEHSRLLSWRSPILASTSRSHQIRTARTLADGTPSGHSDNVSTTQRVPERSQFVVGEQTTQDYAEHAWRQPKSPM